MTFLFESILAVISDIIAGVMDFFTGDFWAGLSIVEIQNGKIGGYFDWWLPGVSSLKVIFQTISATIALLLIALELFKAFLPDSQSIKPQHPFMTLFRAGVSFLCIAYSFSLIAFIQMPMAYLCDMVYKAPQSGRNGIFNDSSASTNGLYPSFGDGFGGNVGDSGRVMFPSADSLAETIADASGVSTLPITFISVLLLGVIAWAFIRLIIEMVERYVIMAFLFYASPLPMCCIVSESTQNIFKSYMRMLLSQYLLIMFNFCFLFVFCYAFTHQPDFAHPPAGIDIGNKKSIVLIYYILLLAWLRLGRSLDEHMSSLGLSVAQTGSGLAGDIIGGVMMTRMAAGAAMTGLRAGKWTASKISDAVRGKHAGAGVNGDFHAGNMQNSTASALNHRYKPAMDGQKAIDGASNALGLDPSTISSSKIGNGQIDTTDSQGNTLSYKPATANTVPTDAMQIKTRGSDGQEWVASVSGNSIENSPMIASAINDGNVHKALLSSNPTCSVDRTANGKYTVMSDEAGTNVYANRQLYTLSPDAPKSGIAESVTIEGQQFYKVKEQHAKHLMPRRQVPNNAVGSGSIDKGVDVLRNKFKN